MRDRNLINLILLTFDIKNTKSKLNSTSAALTVKFVSYSF